MSPSKVLAEQSVSPRFYWARLRSQAALLAAYPRDEPGNAFSSVTVTPFGTMPDGQKVEMYRLKNANGMEVDIITYGGAVQSIKVPGQERQDRRRGPRLRQSRTATSTPTPISER